MADSFPAKVTALREAWLVRRHMKHLGQQRDLASRFELLEVLHGWTGRCLEAIADVYGSSLSIDFTPRPDLATDLLSFAVTLQGQYRVSFALYPRDEAQMQWDLDVQVSTPNSVLAAGQSRSAGQWTRGRVEELLLTLLAAIERAQFDGYRPTNGALGGGQPGSNASPPDVTAPVTKGRTGRDGS